jgi:hypothetical protein
MEFVINGIIMTTKKLGVFAHSKIRVKRDRTNPPVIASVHKEVAEKSGIWLCDDIQILTDGEKVVIQKTEVQKSNFSEQ